MSFAGDEVKTVPAMDSPLARQSLVLTALILMAGITAARLLPRPLELWLRVSLAAIILYLAVSHRPRFAWLCLFLGVFSLSAAWYTERTTLLRSIDIAGRADSVPKLVRVRAHAITAPTVTFRPARPGAAPEPWTRFLVGVDQYQGTSGWIASSGRLDIHSQGDRSDIGVGDELEIFGWLSLPSPPVSQGQFDYRDYLTGLGTWATLRSEDGRSIKVCAVRNRWSVARFRDTIRHWGRSVYERNLSPTAAELASTMILGYRTSLNQEELEPYRTTGTLHLLVVSGTHLVILTAIFWPLAGLIGASVRVRAWIVLLLIAFYAFLTGADPPAVRAAVVVAFWLGGFLLSRKSQPINSLAASAIALLIYNPTSLFSIGSQLSFLAVVTIVLFVPPLLGPKSWTYHEQWIPWFWQRFKESLVNAAVVSLVVGIVLSPLMIFYFHLVTPIGVILSTILLVVVSLALVVGLLLLAVAPIGGGLLTGIAYLTDGILSTVQWIVNWCDQLPLSHAYTASNPLWWVVGFYSLLLLPWLVSGWKGKRLGRRRTYLAANLAWLALGVVLVLRTPRPTTFEYHQLAVGHGNCAVLRFPNGRTILYDCGSLTTPEIADRVVAPWLWANGIGAIDAIILSHADFDHFNGIADLARQFSIGKVFVSPQTARSRQPELLVTFGALLAAEVPMELVWAGDRIPLGDAELHVLQPSPHDAFRSDNEGSLIVECLWQGHRVQMTGDLTHGGIEQILQQKSASRDLFVAPHHGSRLSNPPELAAWARATLVISTQGRSRAVEDGLDPYRELGALVLRTDLEGTISCRWRVDGLQIETFTTKRRFLVPYRDKSQ